MITPKLAAAGNWFAFTTRISTHDITDIILTDAAQLHQAGFTGLELPLPLAADALKQLPVTFWKDLGNQLRDIGIAPVSVHGPNWPGLDAPIAQTTQDLLLYARASVALGVDALVAHPTAHSHPHVCTVVPKLLERDTLLANTLNQALQGTPTRLAIENLPTYGLSYLRALMQRLAGLSHVGICFDTGHFHLRPEGDLTDIVREFNPRIVHLHLTDNHGLCDEHLPPGQGTVDWPGFMRAIDPSWHSRHLLIELGAPSLYSHPDAAQLSLPFHEQAFKHAHACLSGALP